MVRAVTPIPFVKARFFDRCGKPLAGGKIYTYEANTTTPKATYKDPYGLTPNTNPIILDAAGEADIYLEGTYRIRITERNDVLVNDVAKIGSWFSDNLQDTLDNISSAMDDALKPILQNLDETINTAAAAGAGAKGWTSDLVEEDGQTQRVINQNRLPYVTKVTDLPALKNIDFAFVKETNSTFTKNGVDWLPSTTSVNVADYPRLMGEIDDTGRFKRAVSKLKILAADGLSGFGCHTRSDLIIPYGNYVISDEIVINQPINIIGQSNPTIKQTDRTKRTFVLNTHLATVSYVYFIGGKHNIYFSNANTDSGIFTVKECHFDYSYDYAIKTWGSAPNDIHLSCMATFDNCRFIKCNGFIYDVSDSAHIIGGWYYVNKENFTANRATIVNRLGHLFISGNPVGVPLMGTKDANNRLKRVRWIDTYQFLTVQGFRCGGEDEGMPLVYVQKEPSDTLGNLDSNNMTPRVIIRDSQIFCGVRYNYDESGSSVVYFDTQIAGQVTIEDNYYQLACPAIAINPALNADEFFKNITLSTDYRIRNKYKYVVRNNMGFSEEWFAPLYPICLNPFMNNGMVDGTISAVKYWYGFETDGTYIYIRLPNSTKAFSYLLTVASNPAKFDDDRFRNVRTFVVSMNTIKIVDSATQQDKIVNYLSHQVLHTPDKNDKIYGNATIESIRFGEAPQGSNTRDVAEGGVVAIRLFNVTRNIKVSIIPLIEN
ncbi:hypothetical protein ENHY17A_50161 [Moraxellaceae bacterium 17A]|nr:hypothetical protein ENHY17A_50161 [Moraxellaceae bacterium 17A]